MTTALNPENHAVTTAPDARRWQALFILLLANFMNLLDVTIVNVALPSIQQTIGAGFATLQWVVAGYLLVFALGLLPGGRFGDRFGHRRVFLAGVGVFTLASALCGLAPDGGTLVAGRLLQGAGAALMVPQVLAIIHTSFAENERAAAFGLAGAVAGLAVIVGPVLGGGLIALDFFGLGWRWIFLVNLPVGLFVLMRGRSILPERAGMHEGRMDWRGAALAAAGVVLVIYPTITGSEAAWSPALVAAMVTAIPVLTLFVWLQHRQEARGAPTLMPPRLFRRRSYAVGVVLALIFFSGVAGFFMVFAVYLQQRSGHSAMETGLVLLPFALGAFVASAGSAMRKGQANRWLLAAGSAAMAAGMVALLLAIEGAETALAWPVLTALAVAGAGMGLFVVNMFDFSLSEVPDADAGAASGLLHTAQQLGNAGGIAMVGAIFFGTLTLGGPGAWEAAITRALWYEIALYLACTVIAVSVSAGGAGHLNSTK
jgi:EmrB/QacA subfamily drug resistance transporter